jgi:hypothetical protein
LSKHPAAIEAMSVFFGQSDTGSATARSFEKVANTHDMSDPVAYIEAREQRVRENYVAIENAKILREKVIDW